MATVTGRWSRTRARERWQDIATFVGRPLAGGLAVIGLWPSIALAWEWARYDQPFVALGVYVASLVLVGGLWWRGRSGLSLAVSLSAGAAVLALNLTLALQLAPGEPYGAAMWMGGWGAAVPMVLGFGRPVEEPLAILAAFAVTNAVVVVRAEQTVEALHTAPLHIAIPLAVGASGLTLVGALRESAANARSSRSRTEALVQRRRVTEAVDRERTGRVTEWEAGIAPVLEDIAEGRRSVRDPELGATCRQLAASMRADLGDGTESILHALLPSGAAVTPTIHDQDVGHRLVETDRVRLVALLGRLCDSRPGGTLQVTLLPDGDGALVVVAGDGLPAPESVGEGTLLVDSQTRWWFDMSLRCERAPALVAQRHLAGGPDD